MKEFFNDLFEYNHHYNQKIGVVLIENQEKKLEKVKKLFNHIINAHHIWNRRILGVQSKVSVWELNTIQNCLLMDKSNKETSIQILDKYEMNNTINYSTSKGDPFSNTVQEIFFHIINHDTYHRGQIATEFKLQGIEPLVTDYIFYKR